ncbi:MAG: UDP-N-acetylmuramoyl-L-alanyl-D-glutamate--2,6-diaminopimelate ligase [Negativicutes bacterium]|nr:UDP-N-acetylmuramoyl-L-alanyl-D-glutamate--2,6-diaminopimelate ligase [Negativicutes bacterium]
MAKNLRELVGCLAGAEVQGSSDREIVQITYDSRQAGAGSLFVALPGSKVDGHDYVAAACRQGAVAVLVEKDVVAGPEVTVIKVADTRAAMQAMAPFFFDYPSSKLRMIGVTGTNGKTTTTYIIRAILQQAGFRVGLIGTINSIIDQQVLPVKNTTPDVIELQGLLADMVEAGVEYVVMEVSSHALALNRVSGTEFDVGVFTNITRDHLDFHITFANYIEAKAGLFRLLSAPGATKTGKTAVVNSDDPAAQAMLDSCDCRHMTYSVAHSANLKAADIDVRADGAAFTVTGPFGAARLALKITGIFNVYNVLAAMGAALAEGIDLGLIKKAVEEFRSVPGRFELVDAGQPFTVIVDYAHTPDGLENILKTARQFAKRRIIVVFGCGGDRDRTKRPIMGKLAIQYGDVVIATSDNPRSEDPDSILREIEVGLKEGSGGDKNYEIVSGRREAIARALSVAEPQDVVIIAGKGHETYQILKDRTIAFDDREVVREIIREMK